MKCVMLVLAIIAGAFAVNVKVINIQRKWVFIFHNNSYILLFKFLFGSHSVLSSRFADEVRRARAQLSCVVCGTYIFQISFHITAGVILCWEWRIACSVLPEMFGGHTLAYLLQFCHVAASATVSSCFFSLVMSKSGRKMKLVFLTMPLCSGERFAKWWTEVWSV